jgi:predicted nucleotide-binding protein
MDIQKLRELIRTGEYLEDNYGDDKVRSQWLFRVEDFLQKIGQDKRLSSDFFALKNHGGKPIARNNFNNIMGFLRNLYDNDGSVNKLVSHDSQAVFIVHGHDNRLIEKVKGCVEEIGLKPIVLREQVDIGVKTILEKLEEYLGNCKCAVILYTPCDIGRAENENILHSRARQNVVFEHGLFQGFLSRKRVILLRKGDTELPGDCNGAIFISVDSEDWQESLKNSIKAIDQ